MRREFIAASAAGVSLLAGCIGGTASDEGSSDGSATTRTATNYSVTMEPAGTVEFAAVPEKWVASHFPKRSLPSVTTVR